MTRPKLPAGPKARLAVEITPAMRDALGDLAHERRLGYSDLVRRILADALKAAGNEVR